MQVNHLETIPLMIFRLQFKFDEHFRSLAFTYAVWKNFYDLIIMNTMTTKRDFHRIFIVSDKPLAKWSPAKHGMLL